MLEIINGEGFGRDVFMISFLLCGMNTKDIFNATVIKNGRIEYNRSKTRGKRSDEAFISIKIEPELIPLLNKYRDTSGKRVFLFHTIYKESRNFTQYANNSLKKILPGKTTYYARHTWANTARNKCGVSKDIVSESLNHTTGNNVTDTYLERNWSAIDEANRKVIDYYFSISNVSPL
jgi:integrase